MRKKGFTLVELLAVIAILAIIIGLSFVIFIRVQNDVLEKDLNNTILYIEAQAEKYANDTNITVVSVEDLILDGYVEPDDETDIYNPVDNTSLNCYIVKSTYKDGEFTAKLDFDSLLDRNENGTCNNYVQEAIISIGVKEDGKEEYDKEIKDWYKENVELAVLGANNNPLISDKATYEWRSNYGKISIDATVTTEVSEGIVSSIPYRVTINYEENEEKYNAEATAVINIDRESPRIISINVPNSTEYTTSKTVTITAIDGNGSGLKGIYVGKDIETCTEDLDYKEIDDNTVITEEIKEEGTYRACAIDNVGNVSEISEAFEIINVDGAIDNISLTPDKTEITNDNIILTGKAQDEGAGIIGYGHFDNDNPDINNESIWTNISATNDEVTQNRTVSTNGTYYFCAKDALGNVGCAKYEVTNIDKKVPDLTLTANTTSYATTITLTGTATDNKDSNNAASGIKRYQITTTSTKPTSGWTNASDGQMSITTTKSVNNNTTYYLWVEDNVGNVTSKSLRINNIIVLTSKTVDLYSESSSTIPSSLTIDNLVQFSNITVNNGSVSSKSVSGKNVNFTVTGGTTRSSSRTSTCTQLPNSYPAHVDVIQNCYCRTGTLRGNMCTGESYQLQGNNSTMSCVCNNGRLNNCGDSGASTSCAPGYYRDGSYYGCTFTFHDGGACNAANNTIVKEVGHCYATCYFESYPATCTNYNDYYCNYGDVQSYRTCYSCAKGTYSGGTCKYSCQVNYQYWNYTVTINYYKIK